MELFSIVKKVAANCQSCLYTTSKWSHIKNEIWPQCLKWIPEIFEYFFGFCIRKSGVNKNKIENEYTHQFITAFEIKYLPINSFQFFEAVKDHGDKVTLVDIVYKYLKFLTFLVVLTEASKWNKAIMGWKLWIKLRSKDDNFSEWHWISAWISQKLVLELLPVRKLLKSVGKGVK